MKNGSSSAAFAYSYEEQRKKGIHFGPFPLFLLAVVIVASLATIITLSVLFAQQAAELENLKKNTTSKCELQVPYVYCTLSLSELW